MVKKINLPLSEAAIKELNAGDSILLSGYVYTARDAGHKRMCQTLLNGEKLPFDINNSTIYYVGPTPAKNGEIIGSAGPTTSGRMDAYAPLLMDNGLKVMIGKGQRNAEVIDAIKRNGCLYLGAIGGAGALISGCVKENTLIAYEDLGTEALRRLYVENMPLTVIIDSFGNNLYDIGRKEYIEKAIKTVE